jgi:SAM-dependent methyltransferase
MFGKITRPKLVAFLKERSTNQRVLYMGAGAGLFGDYFQNKVTLDIGPQSKPDHVADAHHMPFIDGEFETVVCVEIFEHFRDPQLVAQEINRILKPGGVLILTTRFIFPLHNTPFDFWRFTKYGLQEIFKDWNIVELIPDTKSFSTIGVLLQRIAFQSKVRGGKVTKFFLFALAFLLTKLDWLVTEEYSDITKKKVEFDLMPSGYYMVARKR